MVKFILIKSPDEWATTKQACRDELVVYLFFFLPYIYIDTALWCKNQIEHSVWDESSLFCNCACSLVYSSLSILAGLSYHICGKLEVAFKAQPSSQHCTDEAQKTEQYCLQLVIYE